MRRKNQAVGALKSFYPAGQVMIVSFGKKWIECREACELAMDFEMYLALKADPTFGLSDFICKPAQLEELRKEIANTLMGKMGQARRNPDDSFFRHLADALAARPDKKRSWLISAFALHAQGQFYSDKPPRKVRLTIEQVQKLAENIDWYPEASEVSRMADELGAQLIKSKRGPKPAN